MFECTPASLRGHAAAMQAWMTLELARDATTQAQRQDHSYGSMRQGISCHVVVRRPPRRSAKPPTQPVRRQPQLKSSLQRDKKKRLDPRRRLSRKRHGSVGIGE